MYQTAIVDTTNNTVINVVAYDQDYTGKPLPDYGHEMIGIVDQNARVGWGYNGRVLYDPSVLPIPTVPREVMGSALLTAMTDAQKTTWQTAVDAATPAVRAWWSGNYRFLIPENNPKLNRLGKVTSIDIAALYTAALSK